MASPSTPSKLPSDASPYQLQLDPFVIYLDECLCNCQDIIDVLAKQGVSCERHTEYFARGTPDEIWLPFVGGKRWILVTADKRIRRRKLEILSILEYGLRAFIFTSNNLRGEQKAMVLQKALPVMRKTVESTPPPFVASLSDSGAVKLLMDERGLIAWRNESRN